MKLQIGNLKILLAASLLASLWCAAGSAPVGAAEPQRWALLVGVGDNIRPEFSLYGPKNDVPAVADLLHGQYGFPASHIRRLLNKDATRQNILDGWAWLAHNAHAGDLVVFYYSGHGTAIPEQTPGSEPNGVDSALCPYDAVSRTGLIPGSEIGKCIDRLPTNQVVVIVDACNSGHATRDIRTRQRALSPRDFGLPSVPAAMLTPSEAASAPTATFAGATLTTHVTHKEMYIGAARIDQKAVEGPFLDVAAANAPTANAAREPVGGPPANPNMGAMTHFLLQELRAASGEGAADATTYGELIQRVRRDLRQEYGDEAQEPQISGPDPDTTPFLAERGSAPREASRQKATALPVAVALTTGAGPGESVQLRTVAGATLLPGSILQVGGDRRWTESEGGSDAADNHGGTGVNGTRDVATVSAGLVRVTDVRGARATGIVLSGKASIGLALTEVLRPAPDGRLRVAIGGSGPLAERLRDAASGVENVVVVDSTRPSDVTLYPSAGASTDSKHAVDVYRGEIALPSIAEADVPATLAELQRVKRLANLESAPDAPLHLTVSLNDSVSGSAGFAKARIGDKVRYRISADRDAYITILDLTADGTVVGATRTGKLRAGEVWSLTDIPVVAPAGLDTLKVIATTFPVSMDLPANAAQSKSMGTAGEPAAVAQRVLDALRAGSIAESGSEGPALSAIAAHDDSARSPIAADGWVCADQLLRIDP